MKRTMLHGALAAAMLITAGTLLTAPAQAAAGSCSVAGPHVREGDGRTVPTKYCPTWVATSMWDWNYVAFGGPAPATVDRTAVLNAGNNWMVCQFCGNANPRFGAAGYNHYWILTEGDVNYNGGDTWGYAPATAVRYGGNDQAVPGVPLCQNDGWY